MKRQETRGQEFFQGKRVLVTGASGFVGRNLVPQLREIGCQPEVPSREKFDLLRQDEVRRMFRELAPQVVFHLAALSGGILANRTYPAEFCYRNLLMNTLVLHEAREARVEKYITLIGGCSYPANAPSPIAETEMWNGYPQAESAPYSVAKKMGLVMAEAYRREYGFDAITLIPGNLYGPFDNYDLRHSHVIPAAVRRFYEAGRRGDPEVVMWGTGSPVRDFVYVEDVCRAILLAAATYSSAEAINLSSGTPVSIRELITLIAELSEYRGRVVWDETKPDGQPRKVFDVARMRQVLDFECPTTLRQGLARTIAWFREHYRTARLDFTVTQ